ncbi:MAG: MATE family efflux transporter [Clostridiales bacterium]|nr:MATE family efflux transporter [Clostridiales bacterium]
MTRHERWIKLAITQDLTVGNETKTVLKLTGPMIVGNLFQQLYNVADTIIVGRFIGPNALAAVGSSFSVMVLLNSIILGLCMGSSAVFSILYGGKKIDRLKNSFFVSFCLIGLLTLIINFLALFFIDDILISLNIPEELFIDTRTYLKIIFYGIIFTSGYNYFSAIMRSLGNTTTPLIFLIISALINIVLDIVFIVPLDMGVAGAAYATIIAQAVSAIGLAIYCFRNSPIIRLKRRHLKMNMDIIKMIGNNSILSSIQQSVMNLGILMIQGLVNSFGIPAMAAFAAVVKIESFAYLPEQEFGNGFSIFIAQNYGANKQDRIRNGIKSAIKIITIYGVLISILIILLAKPLVGIFIGPEEIEILRIGKEYLYIVATFYTLIGYLFMFYGLFRGMGKPGMSIILTIISLGTRVALAYKLSAIPSIGLKGIWWAIPIGWALADLLGFYKISRRKAKER